MSGKSCVEVGEFSHIGKNLIELNGMNSLDLYFCGPDAPADLRCECPSVFVCNEFKIHWGDIGHCGCCPGWVIGLIVMLLLAFLVSGLVAAYLCMCRGTWWCDGFEDPPPLVLAARSAPVAVSTGATVGSNIFRGYRPAEFDTGALPPRDGALAAAAGTRSRLLGGQPGGLGSSPQMVGGAAATSPGARPPRRNPNDTNAPPALELAAVTSMQRRANNNNNNNNDVLDDDEGLASSSSMSNNTNGGGGGFDVNAALARQQNRTSATSGGGAVMSPPSTTRSNSDLIMPNAISTSVVAVGAARSGAEGGVFSASSAQPHANPLPASGFFRDIVSDESGDDMADLATTDDAGGGTIAGSATMVASAPGVRRSLQRE